MSVERHVQACFCGSGRPVPLCHELPRGERRRRRGELDALAEAHDLASLFPGVRPRDEVFDAFAERAGATLGPEQPAPPVELVENGLALLDDAERRRIVESWSRVYPARWASLVRDGGVEPLLSRAVVFGAVGVSILEWRRVPAAALDLCELGDCDDVPANALTLLVEPPLVWSIEDAMRAASRHRRRSRQFEPAHFEAIAAYGARVMSAEHRLRLRAAAGRIDAQLPIGGRPRATRLLRDGCEVLLRDDWWCRAIGGRLLALYTASPLVERELAVVAKAERRRAI